MPLAARSVVRAPSTARDTLWIRMQNTTLACSKITSHPRWGSCRLRIWWHVLISVLHPRVTDLFRFILAKTSGEENRNGFWVRRSWTGDVSEVIPLAQSVFVDVPKSLCASKTGTGLAIEQLNRKPWNPVHGTIYQVRRAYAQLACRCNVTLRQGQRFYWAWWIQTRDTMPLSTKPKKKRNRKSQFK